MTTGKLFGRTDNTYAKVIADSITPTGDRLTTMEVQCHRFVLAEFNTHRKFSRNSASSRAIPVDKQIQRVRDNPAIPLVFPAEQKGMQGGEDLSPYVWLAAQKEWEAAARNAVITAENLAFLGVHKSVVNRILEPFMWHKIIVSSTEWDNFFDQRCSRLAQPEIFALATHMRDALADSSPIEIPYGMFHLPYMTAEDILDCHLIGMKAEAISAARCARVSYLTHDGKRSLRADIELYEKLIRAEPKHLSPLEHVATPGRVYDNPSASNFDGWRQLRYDIENR